MEGRQDGVVWRTGATLAAGMHHLKAVYRKPAGTVAALTVDMTLDGCRQSCRHSRPDLTSAGEPQSPTTGWCWSGLCGVLYQFWLAFGAERKLRPRFGATNTSALAAWSACAVVLAAAFVVAKPLFGITVELSYGDDWLAYESNARNVMEEGLLMPLGQTPGHAGPYFFYPLYCTRWLACTGWWVTTTPPRYCSTEFSPPRFRCSYGPSGGARCHAWRRLSAWRS